MFPPGLQGAAEASFYPSELLVAQHLVQMEGEISLAEADLSACSPEVVTLTFPPAYAIPPTPSVFSPHPALIGPPESCNFKSLFEVARGAENKAEPRKDGPRRLRKVWQERLGCAQNSCEVFSFWLLWYFQSEERKRC